MRYVKSLSDMLGKPASAMAFGCAMPNMLRGEEVGEVLDAAFAAGITIFDTAEAYGLSEVSLGSWIAARGRREDIILISKGCHPAPQPDGTLGPDRMNPDALRADIEQSLERLKTDYLDIYFLHRDDLKLGVGPIMEALNGYVRTGAIRQIGASNWSHTRIQAANDYARDHGLQGFTISSPGFSLAVQECDPWGGGSGCVDISGPANRDARAWYRERDMPVLAYAALGHGMLSGKVRSDSPATKELLDDAAQRAYASSGNLERLRRCEELAERHGATVPQVAVAWVLSQTDITALPIVSTSRVENVRANASALDIELTADEVSWLALEA